MGILPKTSEEKSPCYTAVLGAVMSNHAELYYAVTSAATTAASVTSAASSLLEIQHRYRMRPLPGLRRSLLDAPPTPLNSTGAGCHTTALHTIRHGRDQKPATVWPAQVASTSRPAHPDASATARCQTYSLDSIARWKGPSSH